MRKRNGSEEVHDKKRNTLHSAARHSPPFPFNTLPSPTPHYTKQHYAAPSDPSTHQTNGYIASLQYSFPYNINSRLIGAGTLEKPAVTPWLEKMEMEIDGRKE